MPARPITFLSDYGYEDEFAGVCRAVIARVAPAAQVIDLSHGIRRLDVAQGATVLAASVPFAPAGVHLAVVDPGVGTKRRAVAVRAAEEERWFVGPDNGLLSPALERFGGPVEALEISSSPARLEPVSATFHGRDLFAPVAAALALGDRPPAELGEPLDPAALVALELPAPRVDAGSALATTAIRVDGFGNVALAGGETEAREAGLEPGATVGVRAGGAGGEQMRATFASTFGDVDDGALLLYLGAAGALTIGVNGASAARRLGVEAGDAIELRPLERAG